MRGKIVLNMRNFVIIIPNCCSALKASNQLGQHPETDNTPRNLYNLLS